MDDGVAVQGALHSRKGVERVLRYGFEEAKKSGKKLTMATKSNALKYGMVFWDEIFEIVKADYKDVEAEKCHIDALSMNFCRIPENYGVVVASNLFGDILSDIGGTISGGIGLAPSANLNPEKKFPSLFEPVHGSAPDIAGKGIANPIAAIRSGAMLLDFIGMKEASAAIENSVNTILKEGKVLTPDLGGKATTSGVGDEIARIIKSS
jgi:tartrate dehydrogenase/decarboxylase/D-malate dehydrogenase